MKFIKSTIALLILAFSIQGHAISLQALQNAELVNDFLGKSINCNTVIANVFVLHDVTPEGLYGNPEYALVTNDTEIIIRVKFVEANEEEITLESKATYKKVTCKLI